MKYIGENAIKKLISLIKSDLKKKLDKNQGTANSGKILGVNATGEVAPADTEVATLVDVPNGIVKGDGNTLSAAVAGTDYMAPVTGGTVGQVLTKTANSQQWADAPKSLPDGGTAGDALVKSTDGGSWETPVEASLVDLPVITASQTDLTVGTSPLATGELYVVYE